MLILWMFWILHTIVFPRLEDCDCGTDPQDNYYCVGNGGEETMLEEVLGLGARERQDVD